MTLLARDANQSTIQAIFPGNNQSGAYTGTPYLSNPVSAACTIVRLVTTTDSHYVVGIAPVAGATDTFLPAKTVEFVSIGPNQKVSVVQDAAGGTAYLSEGM